MNVDNTNAGGKEISLSLFFPAYNEEENIGKTISEALKAAGKLGISYEIIVVNDGSSDKTREIAEKISAADSRVRVVNHASNLGYGAALWSGIQASRCEYIFFSDSDLQFDLDEIAKLVEFIPEYDVVLGYREKRRDPFGRIVNACLWNLLNRMLFSLKVKDIDCAFKIFKRDKVKDLRVISSGAMLSAEILIRLRDKGIRFKEVPVTHMPRMAGVQTGAKLSVVAKALKEMSKVYASRLDVRR